MNKDIIYIDVEDDITAIIGKIKASTEKIVAIVPPKHTGILQSAVNLRLLNRMANTSHKRLVLITNNQALIALSASAGIPYAKNLQSKPELAEISAVAIDDGDDIIDGSTLSVGQHIDLSKKAAEDKAISEKEIESIDIDNSSLDVSEVESKEDKTKTTKKSSGIKVPNFKSFRKRFFLLGGLAVLLIVFLVWANVFAPSARVIITAKTSPASVSSTVTLVGNGQTEIDKGTVQSVSQQLKKDTVVEFDATGTKTVGEKAAGKVIFSNCDTSTQVTIDAGTYISANGNNYVVQADTVVGPGSFSGGSCSSAGTSVSTDVKAADIGSDYNAAPETSFLVSGYSSGMTANTTAGIAGGTSREVKVPTAADIQTATTKLEAQSDDAAKKELTAKFASGEIIIDDSFTVVNAAPVSTPAVDTESKDGKAKLTATTTYTMTALPRADVEAYLKENINKQLTGTTNQKIYNDGLDTVKLQNFTKSDGVTTVKIVGTGQIGPSIEESVVKDQVKGKIYGEVQSSLESISGIDSVDVKFSYFWVTKVPNDTNKISVEFNILHE